MTRRVCVFCVMDDSNPGIVFDEMGRCSGCRDALARMPHEWWPGDEGRKRLDSMARQLRAAGRGRPYDAMIGLSGGIDSAYLAHYVVKELGLRVLAVHVDGGWNSEPAVRNIESIVRKLDIDLHTEVIEWQEMRDLQLAFLRASVLNQDIPQDHAFFSTLYRTAGRFGVRYFLSGVNFASESVSPPLQGSPTAIDGVHVRAVHRRMGNIKLRRFPIMGLTEYFWRTRVARSINILKPLNYLPYDKEIAKAELTLEYNWCDYGGKHHESRFTRFYEQIYLPRKYGFDKRRQHLSSLIVSGQMTREEAVRQIDSTAVDTASMMRDIRFVAKKLGITPDQMEGLLEEAPIEHSTYPSQMRLHNMLSRIRSSLRVTPD